MVGWIKLHRCIWNNPVVTKDSDHVAIWLWLLTHAQIEDKEILFAGEKITLKRGQLITGRKLISEQLKINESKVYRTLNELQKAQQIEQQKTKKGSVISIINWDKYQLREQQNEHQNEQQLNNKRTTTEQQLNTTKEYREYINNINNNIQQQQESSGGQRFLSSYLSEDEWDKLTRNYDEAVKLIDTVDELVSEPEKVINPFRYIVGFAKNKNWPRKAGAVL